MKHLLTFLLTFFALACAVPTAFAQTWRVEDDTVSQIGDDGAVEWTNTHPSIWANDERTSTSFGLTAPARHRDTVYYSLGAWLIAADPATGVIRRRTPFPAPISEIRFRDDGALEVEVDHDETMIAEETVVVFRHRPGDAGPLETWSMLAWFAPWRDADFIDPKLSTRTDDLDALDSTDRARLVDVVAKQAKQDPTNAFYDWMLGALKRPDDPKVARKHFAEAAGKESMRGTSDVQLALLLDSVGEVELSTAVFDRGAAKLERELPELSNTWAMVTAVMLVGVFGNDQVEDAVAAGDHERAHRLLDRMYLLFPSVERSPDVWRLFADWLEEQDAAEQAAKWRLRAEAGADLPVARIDAAAEHFDLSAVCLWGCVLGAWLAAFVLGVRSPRGEGSLPRPRLLELIALLAVMFATVPCLVVMGVSVELIGLAAGAPIDAFNGSWASPDTLAFLEQLAPSEASEVLLEHGQAAVEAYATGGVVPPPPPEGTTLLVDAMTADAMDAFVESFEFSAVSEIGAALPRAEASIALTLFPPIVLFLLGAFMGRNGSVARLIEALVPGGSPSARFLTPLVTAAFCAAFGALVLDFDTLLRDIAVPAFPRFFGLGALAEADMAVSRAWAWALLAVVSLLHVATIVLDWRDRRARKPSTPQ